MAEQSTTLPQDLLDILVCPADKAKVNLQDGKLVCEQCGRAYPVRDGIPIMLIDEAEVPGSS
ncbi:MAG TPA: Trm112 family protein [Chloroflexia bacterium]|nr:Trm112 family protein [Chloroflexia bacterium]